ncbi:hypothetical protein SAMN05421504_103644 [Amycolatopsis xylanica]|uniref:Uncharacterized protein n=1 Tax=Amycolatopsis xylanica TaxID=589385 RepID=A0A1H3E3B8_9PSEU|nr:hypothetical protein [Amycolatopsis xylanica]SDX73223.1 hypothetical protein SAMN05421504_103644 [Amycolatopsis xylanica]
MVRFEFSRREDLDHIEPPSGFDLGDMEIVGNVGSVSSRGRAPDQGMMIFVALVELLDGLRRKLKPGHPYEFVGADSSFILDFREENDSIVIESEGRRIDSSPKLESLRALSRATHAFVDKELSKLPPDDAAKEDLVPSVADFDAYVTDLARRGG